MRKILFTLAAFAMIMVSCTQDNDLEIERNEGRTVTISAAIPGGAPNTRVSLEPDGNTPHGIILKWENDDELKLGFEHGDNFYYNSAPIIPSSISADGLRADFAVTIPAEIPADDSFNIFGVYQRKSLQQFDDETGNPVDGFFEPGTKDFILYNYEVRALTLDKDDTDYTGLGQWKTRPALYFSQNDIQNSESLAINPINLKHSGWMIALHFKNASGVPIMPQEIYLYARNSPKVWNGNQRANKVTLNADNGTAFCDRPFYIWRNNTILFNMNYAHNEDSKYFGETIAPGETVVFYRWLISEGLDLNTIDANMVYTDSAGFKESKAPTDLPGRTVKNGNVFNVYTKWQYNQFSFVDPY